MRSMHNKQQKTHQAHSRATMNVNTPASSLRRSPAKAANGSHLPTNLSMSKSFYIVLAIAIGAAGLLFMDNQQGYYLKTSLRKSDDNNIGLASSSGTTDILQLRVPKEADGDIVSNEDDGEEPQLESESVVAISEFEKKTDELKASPLNNINPVDTSIEQKSRAFPIWINNRRAVDNNSRPYGWCVSEDLATNDESPKGLLFVKVHKSGSSTGAGVTLRIRDGLSRRLTHLNNETAPVNCFAHYNHATASELGFEKRDPSQSFLWSIVREPAQRTLR
eukprot:scaffold6280_cov127-Skeletonema_marinoi.AAC.4